MDQGMQSLDQRPLPDLFFHPAIRLDGAPCFDIFTRHTDDVSTSFMRAGETASIVPM